MPAKVYTQKEAKITPIKKKTLAVIGYGSQGHAHALNLKDSGCKVIIGLYKGSKSIRVAKKHGFEVTEVAEAVHKADIIMIGVPDMKQAEVYETEIKPNLSKGKTLLFTHGFAIHFGLIKPPRGVSVIMVAPKGPGHVVRSQFKEGKGVPALIAVLKGSSKDSKKIALAWAAGVRRIKKRLRKLVLRFSEALRVILNQRECLLLPPIGWGQPKSRNLPPEAGCFPMYKGHPQSLIRRTSKPSPNLFWGQRKFEWRFRLLSDYRLPPLPDILSYCVSFI